MKYALAAGVLLLTFAAIPSAKVAPYKEYRDAAVTPEVGGLFTRNYEASPVPGTEKSGLWVAVEGRLKWLGVL